MSPKLAEEYSIFRREQILTATWECFVEKGYHKTTLREIAKHMNVSTGVIYNYFKGKNEIFEALHQWNLENTRQVFEQLCQKDSPMEAMGELFKKMFECCTDEELQKSVRGNLNFWSEAMKRKNLQKKLNTHYIFMHKNISTLVKQGIERGVIETQLKPEAYADFFLAVLNGIQLHLAINANQDIGPYLNDIKKILFSNIWRNKK